VGRRSQTRARRCQTRVASVRVSPLALAERSTGCLGARSRRAGRDRTAAAVRLFRGAIREAKFNALIQTATPAKSWRASIPWQQIDPRGGP
jgi:hypothetical protein